MPTTHTVAQGEYLSLIAESYGFHSYAKIWDDPANADLKRVRQNPNVLLPGDALVIPDRVVKQESRASGARHKFVVPFEQLMLRLVLRDDGDQPLANVACRLDVEGQSYTLTTDGQGKVEQVIPKTARAGRLVARDAEQAVDLDLPLGVGELDPADTRSGQVARLNNLGYDAGSPVEVPAGGGEGGDDPAVAALAAAAKQQFQSAVEEFQCDRQLGVDGLIGASTQAALIRAHGC